MHFPQYCFVRSHFEPTLKPLCLVIAKCHDVRQECNSILFCEVSACQGDTLCCIHTRWSGDVIWRTGKKNFNAVAGVLSSDLFRFPSFQRVLQTFFIYAWCRIAINHENFPPRYMQQILPSFASKEFCLTFPNSNSLLYLLITVQFCKTIRVIQLDSTEGHVVHCT